MLLKNLTLLSGGLGCLRVNYAVPCKKIIYGITK